MPIRLSYAFGPFHRLERLEEAPMIGDILALFLLSSVVLTPGIVVFFHACRLNEETYRG